MEAQCGTENLRKAGINNPTDLITFPWDKKPAPPLTDKEREDLQAERDASEAEEQAEAAPPPPPVPPVQEFAGGGSPASTTQMNFCPNCGAKLTPGTKFCTQCGQLLIVN
jgi:hypothetical protein